ncbi:hypothetical protein [Noviherbaspirillum sp.]|uniref:hypothetical protein n=1 Tax=Noviherbaspirillum sp. TaxID=1926288 RepID=UPI002FE1F245
MRYFEISERTDANKQRIESQKERAKQMTKNAKRATQEAKAAELRLKQKMTQDALAAINRSK